MIISVYQAVQRTGNFPVRCLISPVRALGAGLRLLRLVGAERKIHAPADILKFRKFSAGAVQLGVFRFPLCFEGGIKK